MFSAKSIQVVEVGGGENGPAKWDHFGYVRVDVFSQGEGWTGKQAYLRAYTMSLKLEEVERTADAKREHGKKRTAQNSEYKRSHLAARGIHVEIYEQVYNCWALLHKHTHTL